MGRHIRLVAILAIGAALITALPVSAATSGGKCAKAGQVQTTKGAKYKCTKSGKVFKWVKVAPAAKNTNATTSKGVNGPVGITSWTTTVSPNPRPGATRQQVPLLWKLEQSRHACRAAISRVESIVFQASTVCSACNTVRPHPSTLQKTCPKH